MFLESAIEKNNIYTKEELIEYAATIDKKYVLNSTEDIESVYYIGNKEDDRKLIWQEGMVLPEYQ